MNNTRDKIDLQFPALDHTESVANIFIKVTNVNPQNGITIQNAFSCISYSHYITIMNLGKQAEMTVKAGDAYPNSMLGDITIQIPNGVSCIQIYDLSRFEKADGSLDLDFSENFNGTIYAIGKYKR